MRLFELAYCCRLYGQRTRFDQALKRLQDGTDDHVDLTKPEHVHFLLQWLRDWGVRPLRTADDAFSSERLVEWDERHGRTLPAAARTLHDLSDAELDTAATAYEALAEQQAAWRHRADGALGKVRFGPTAAAKVMYAMRPHAFVPWDDPIRKALRWDGSGASYRRALVRARDELTAVADDATNLLHRGITVSELPALVGRPHSAPPKLIDEHDWARITSGFEPPTPEEVRRWNEWSGP